uniref:NADH-ubiquinone oxidoreductase chain 4L n=1 Tax=Brachytemnus porcatus TaxID=1069889 RepID=J9PGS0_9CUCU|nr:NADH dehydrogenase subunit 4L [Brachytemnus porcatus]
MMMNDYSYSFVAFFFCSLFIYVVKFSHFLVMLMSLESMVLSLFMLMFMYLSDFMTENFMSLYFLTMSVCESALGLSLLVLIIRTHGSDKILVFDSLW